MRYQTIDKSSNSKTGPMGTVNADESTCPPDCPFKGSGCYGDNYHCRLNWDKVNAGARGGSIIDLTAWIRALPRYKLWRYGVIGDLPGKGNDVDRKALMDIVRANRFKFGYAYTHKPVIDNEKNAEAIRTANLNGFTVNLSANGVNHADELYALNIAPVVTVLPRKNFPKRTPKGVKIKLCPNYINDKVTCASCGLCQKRKRKYIIGLPAHGTGAKKVEAIYNAN
jgi:hypothetical protein